jgi:hypothetical protein
MTMKANHPEMVELTQDGSVHVYPESNDRRDRMLDGLNNQPFGPLCNPIFSKAPEHHFDPELKNAQVFAGVKELTLSESLPYEQRVVAIFKAMKRAA